MTTGATGNHDLHHRDLHLCLLASWKPQFKGDTCAQTKCSNILYTSSWMLLNALTIAIEGLTAEVIHDGSELLLLLLLLLHRRVCPSRRRVTVFEASTAPVCRRTKNTTGNYYFTHKISTTFSSTPKSQHVDTLLSPPLEASSTQILETYIHVHVHVHVHVHDLYFTWMCCLTSWCFMK